MRATRTKIFYCALAVSILQSSLSAFEPEVNVSVRKDLVLGSDLRQTVLKVCEKYLEDENEEYLSKIENLEYPFSFDKPEVEVVKKPAEEKTTVVSEPEPINYSDRSVLDVAAASFARKVRGSLARGDKNFLQMEGGVLLKPGSSFPVRIPQVQDKSFELTVSEITAVGYTLELGDAVKQISFSENPESTTIQLSNP